MTRIRRLLTCLLGAVLVISLPGPKGELKRQACCAGAAVLVLPVAPAPRQWTKGTAAVGRIEGPPKVLDSVSPVSAGTSRGREVPMKGPVLARGWEHSDDVTDLGNVDVHAPLVGVLTPSMKDETVICGATAVSNCGYGGPKKGPLPLNLRRSGAGVALTISHTNIWIEPSGVRFSTSVTF